MNESEQLLQGSDPLNFASLPFPVAEQIAVAMGGAEADRWINWIASSDIIDMNVAQSDSPDALDELWGAVLRAMQRGWFTSSTWDELAAAGPVPLWCRAWPGLEEFFGPGGCWMTAALIALATRWTERVWHSHWMLPEDAYDERSMPLISIPGGRGIAINQFASLVYQALTSGQEETRDSGVIRNLIAVHLPAQDGEDSDPEDAELEGPAVEPFDDEGQYAIYFSDLQAYDEDERVDRFASALDTANGVERAYREDRELVVANTTLTEETLQDLANQLWETAAG